MKKIFIEFIIVAIFGISFGLINTTNAIQDPGFEIIPDATTSNIGQTVDEVGVGGSVWDNYKDKSNGEKIDGKNGPNTRKGSDMSLGDQLASGIMSWDTLLDYAVYLVKFIGQLALLAGAMGIIYYGYSKATEHLKGGGSSKLGMVVAGILVVSFAYVIIKVVWSMFVS